MRKKKALGQYFLKSSSILRKIILTAELSRDDTVLEIGPGTGVLTKALIDRAKRVVAVEKDPELCQLLTTKFSNQKNVEIICADILKINPSNFNLKDLGFKIVANIPYYLTGRLLRLIFESWPRPSLAVLMLQKEVAERIARRPPKANRLSAIIQYFSSPEIISIVSRRAFKPQPKVDSAIVALRNIQPPKPEDKSIIEVIVAGFSHPRKLLLTNLAKRFGRQRALSALSKLSSSSLLRPSELEKQDWERLATLLLEKNQGYNN
jgi:16S rRNA (adenine1518-N6/adenine1519-N6)-dimethyltransferase